MAIIRIKEGSFTIDVFDDDNNLVGSMHFLQDKITFDKTVVEALKKDGPVVEALKKDGPEVAAEKKDLGPVRGHVPAEMKHHGPGKVQVRR